HAGGAIAIANHLAGLVSGVGLLAQVGEIEGREDFIRRQLRANVTPYFVQRTNAPTIHKRRFVDHHTGARMLELYIMDDAPAIDSDKKRVADQVNQITRKFDIVIVADYGHGMMARPVIDAVTQNARFLSVNTQCNAGNRGFNSISRYRRADYVCL